VASTDLGSSNFYLNRELSQLDFARRVLAMAKSRDVPMFERLRYLCITSSILDEFFEVRVAGLKQQAAYGSVQREADNLSADEQLVKIAESAKRLVADLYGVLNDELTPALSAEGVRLLGPNDWTEAQVAWLKRFFSREVAPIVSPMGLDPAHPFPETVNKSLAFIVILAGRDAFGRNSGRAIVQVPRSLPRVIRLPDDVSDGRCDMVLLATVVRYFVSDLFLGMKATGCHQFRVTRNSDLFVDEEAVDDLLIALEGELSSRRFGDAVRLEVSLDCPEELACFLIGQFGLTDRDLYVCQGPVNLGRLDAIPDLVEAPELKYPSFRPRIPELLRRSETIFEAIADNEVLLHHPYESFAPFVEMLR
jgi:polyphosphate kinase